MVKEDKIKAKCNDGVLASILPRKKRPFKKPTKKY
ncbi:hypothetical protein [Flagellimonas maritima]